MVEQVDPLIGKTLSGRFEIVAPLGAGGMGRVYRAIQHPLDRVVALKVLNPRYDGAKDPGFEKRFFLEASMTAKLKHPNTITVHDYGRTDDGIYFIAMELVEGETLQQVLVKTGPLAWPRAIFMGAQVARSIREAHRLGLVHRDLKPANIMMLSDGASGDVVKVLDFGLVKDMALKPKLREGKSGENRTEITQTGILLGSPLYMAPEQARNELDPRSDIYSLGVVLFQAIAGRTPFVGKESIDIIVKHVREAPPELKDLAEVPPEVNGLVMKCLEKQPSARFQNMDELLEAMHQATAGQGVSGIFVDPRSASGAVTPHGQARAATPRGTRMEPVSVRFDDEPPKRVDKRWAVGLIVAGLGLILGGLLVGGLWATQPSEPAAAPRPAPAPPTTGASPTVEPTPAPEGVVFDITSEPSGATVRRGSEVLGQTPLLVTLARPGEEPLRVTLTFSLPGYQDTSLTAIGAGGKVPVHGVLPLARPPVELAPLPSPTRLPARVPPPAPRKPASANPNPNPNPNGYKDDPYE